MLVDSVLGRSREKGFHFTFIINISRLGSFPHLGMSVLDVISVMEVVAFNSKISTSLRPFHLECDHLRLIHRVHQLSMGP